MDGITAGQIRTAQIWETTERKNSALVGVLKQACSRNKAGEKQDLWAEKDRQDHGNRATVSLKSNTGEVHTATIIPKGAEVTSNNVNKYAEERAKLADRKEDVQLARFCDGNDPAWRPDTFFTETCGQQEVPPWPIRPTELFTNPHLVMRILAQQMEKKKKAKKEKKALKEAKKAAKKRKKDKKRGIIRSDSEEEKARKKAEEEAKAKAAAPSGEDAVKAAWAAVAAAAVQAPPPKKPRQKGQMVVKRSAEGFLTLHGSSSYSSGASDDAEPAAAPAAAAAAAPRRAAEKAKAATADEKADEPDWG